MIDAGAILPQRLRDGLGGLGSVVVAYSGGVDSSLLAVAAQAVLGRGAVRAVTAVSPSLGADELVCCERVASQHGIDWIIVETHELDDDRYSANGADRCFWCKTHLMDALVPLAGEATIVLGVNLDDLADHRPGQRAAFERGARFPLAEAGLTKEQIRDLSADLGLETWDQPAAPCLASRLPYGTPVTMKRLSQVERAERGVRALGFAAVRVRHHGDVGLVEVPADEIDRAIAHRVAIIDVVRGAGYRFVALDLEGLQSGRLNRALA